MIENGRGNLDKWLIEGELAEPGAFNIDIEQAIAWNSGAQKCRKAPPAETGDGDFAGHLLSSLTVARRPVEVGELHAPDDAAEAAVVTEFKNLLEESEGEAETHERKIEEVAAEKDRMVDPALTIDDNFLDDLDLWGDRFTPAPPGQLSGGSSSNGGGIAPESMKDTQNKNKNKDEQKLKIK